MPVSAHCVAILEEPLTQDICYGFRRIRARVMCLAWYKMDNQHIPFRQAINEAWAEIRQNCAEIGAYV